MRTGITLAALALVVAACVGGTADAPDTASPLPTAPADQEFPDAAGACLEGEPDCQDIGDPNAPPTPLPDPDAEPVERTPGMSVGEALASEPEDGSLVVEGFVVVDADGNARICSALAESFPPQCGGDVLEVDGTIPNLHELRSAQGVTWSDFPILVEGTFDGTTFSVSS